MRSRGVIRETHQSDCCMDGEKERERGREGEREGGREEGTE